jgi:putative ABC transport system permease protein
MSQNPRSLLGSLSRAWRSHMRRPGSFLIAVGSLAVALGLATTIIAQIDSLMHPYSPVRDVDRVFSIRVDGRGLRGRPSLDDQREALAASGLFESVVPVSQIAEPIRIGSSYVASWPVSAGREYFDLIGMSTRLGRLFTSSETREDDVAIVSDRLWRDYFGNTAALERAVLSIQGRNLRIVGVVSAEWDRRNAPEPVSASHRFITSWKPEASVWIPRAPGIPDPRTFTLFIVRLAAGANERRAKEGLEALSERWRQQFGDARPVPLVARMSSMRPDPLSIRAFHRAMMAAAIFIIVIASANVSAIILARSVARRRDQALRLALGAGRSDLLRDIAAEVVIVALIGGAGGLLIAAASMGIMTAVTPPELTWLGFARPNWNPRVFGGLFAAVAVCIGLSALGPALYSARIAPAEPLKDGSGTTTGRAASRFKLLVVGELALAMILLFGASLIGKTAHNVSTFDFGYEARNIGEVSGSFGAVTTLTRPVPPESIATVSRYPEILRSELDVIAERLRSHPDVHEAAWYTYGGAFKDVVVSSATTVLDSIVYKPKIMVTGPGFLRTLGVPLVEGRDFIEGDADRGGVILDLRAAHRLFPAGDALQGRIKFGPADSKMPWLPVVGVAQNAAIDLPAFAELEPQTVIYATTSSVWNPRFVVRAAREVTDIGPLATGLVRDRVPHGVSLTYRKWTQYYDSMLAGRRFTAGMFAILSIASLILATAGLFGVLSYAVNQRMREFALRVALGAQRIHVLRLVFRDSFVMALGGTAIGAFVGLYVGFEVWDWLWGVYPVDAAALVIAEGSLLAVTIGASMLPALRASRADPAEVMRSI